MTFVACVWMGYDTNESQKNIRIFIRGENNKKKKTIKEEKGQWKNIQCIIYLTLQQNKQYNLRWVCVCVCVVQNIQTSIKTNINQYKWCVCVSFGILYSCHHTNNLTRCTMIIILSLDFPLYCVKFYLGCRWVKCL